MEERAMRDDGQAFDYVIVGGGSAGCVLADRLSADGRHRVCLLEAGPRDRNPLIRMPTGIIPLVRGWACNWKRSEEHTSELQSLMRISYAVFCLKKKTHKK